MITQSSTQDAHHQAAVDAFAPDVARFVAGYDFDPRKRQELLQTTKAHALPA